MNVKDIHLFKSSPFGLHSGQCLVNLNDNEWSKLHRLSLQLNNKKFFNYKLNVELTDKHHLELDLPSDKPIKEKYRTSLLNVKNQPLDCSKEDLALSFEKFGKIKWLEIIHLSKKKYKISNAFIMFENPISVTNCLKHGVYLHDTKLNIQPYSRRINYNTDKNFKNALNLGFKGNSNLFKHRK